MSAIGRLQIDSSSTQMVVNEGFFTLWSASSLDSSVELACSGCGSTVVQHGHIKQWKDLPSEGWAEMMDLWHCHKPHEHDTDDHGGHKGYAAGSRLMAQAGVGFVDTLGFLLVEKDCSGIKV